MTNESTTKKRPRGRPIDANAQEAKIDAILAGARRCIVRDGVKGTRIAAIAKEVGVSEANIYQYFRSKNDIIHAFIDHELAAKKSLFGRMAEADDLLDGFALVLDVMDATKEAAILRTELNAAAICDESIRAKISKAKQEADHAMASMLTVAKKSSALRPDLNEDLAAQLMQSITDGWYARLAIEAGDFQTMKPIFIDFVRHFLLQDPSRPNYSKQDQDHE